MFRFANPYYFFLLIPVGLAAWIVYRKNIKSGILFSATLYIPPRKNTWRIYAANILPVIFLTGIILGIAALARPQTILSKVHRKTDAIAIEMVVDVSGSMRALDMSIMKNGEIIEELTRLDVVKRVFADFVEKRPDDLIGLITFGGFATTRAPLTIDHAALAHTLKGVEIPKQIYDKKGQPVNQEEFLTAIGDGLTTACGRLEKAEQKSKIIVLLSDGESNTGIIKPEEAIYAAKELKIKVYTIGAGSTGRALVKSKDIFGRNIKTTANVVLDEKVLKEIAEQTGGTYFNVKDSKGMEAAMSEIDKLEKTETEREEYTQHTELFPWPLWFAICLIILGTTLNMMISKRII